VSARPMLLLPELDAPFRRMTRPRRSASTSHNLALAGDGCPASTSSVKPAAGCRGGGVPVRMTTNPENGHDQDAEPPTPDGEEPDTSQPGPHPDPPPGE
jgi:hypothetical protein